MDFYVNAVASNQSGASEQPPYAASTLIGGSDSAAGTAAAPLKTIKKALQKGCFSRAGDRLVLSGDFREAIVPLAFKVASYTIGADCELTLSANHGLTVDGASGAGGTTYNVTVFNDNGSSAQSATNINGPRKIYATAVNKVKFSPPLDSTGFTSNAQGRMFTYPMPDAVVTQWVGAPQYVINGWRNVAVASWAADGEATANGGNLYHCTIANGTVPNNGSASLAEGIAAVAVDWDFLIDDKGRHYGHLTRAASRGVAQGDDVNQLTNSYFFVPNAAGGGTLYINVTEAALTGLTITYSVGGMNGIETGTPIYDDPINSPKAAAWYGEPSNVRISGGIIQGWCDNGWRSHLNLSTADISGGAVGTNSTGYGARPTNCVGGIVEDCIFIDNGYHHAMFVGFQCRNNILRRNTQWGGGNNLVGGFSAGSFYCGPGGGLLADSANSGNREYDTVHHSYTFLGRDGKPIAFPFSTAATSLNGQAGTWSANNPGGSSPCTITAGSALTTPISDGQRIKISGVTGSTNLNGIWSVSNPTNSTTAFKIPVTPTGASVWTNASIMLMPNGAGTCLMHCDDRRNAAFPAAGDTMSQSGGVVNVASTGHGMNTGESVTVTTVPGSITGVAAGDYAVTRVDANNYTLNGVVGGGTSGNCAWYSKSNRVSDNEFTRVKAYQQPDLDACFGQAFTHAPRAVPPANDLDWKTYPARFDQCEAENLGYLGGYSQAAGNCFLAFHRCRLGFQRAGRWQSKTEGGSLIGTTGDNRWLFVGCDLVIDLDNPEWGTSGMIASFLASFLSMSGTGGSPYGRARFYHCNILIKGSKAANHAKQFTAGGNNGTDGLVVVKRSVVAFQWNNYSNNTSAGNQSVIGGGGLSSSGSGLGNFDFDGNNIYANVGSGVTHSYKNFSGAAPTGNSEAAWRDNYDPNAIMIGAQFGSGDPRMIDPRASTDAPGAYTSLATSGHAPKFPFIDRAGRSPMQLIPAFAAIKAPRLDIPNFTVGINGRQFDGTIGASQGGPLVASETTRDIGALRIITGNRRTAILEVEN